MITKRTHMIEKYRKIETKAGKIEPVAWCRNEVKRMNEAMKRRGAKPTCTVIETKRYVWIEG